MATRQRMDVHQQQPTTKRTGGFPRSSLIQLYEATISHMFKYATAGHPQATARSNCTPDSGSLMQSTRPPWQLDSRKPSVMLHLHCSWHMHGRHCTMQGVQQYMYSSLALCPDEDRPAIAELIHHNPSTCAYWHYAHAKQYHVHHAA